MTKPLAILALGLLTTAPAAAQDRPAKRPGSPFAVRHVKGAHVDVTYKGKPVLRLMIGDDTSDEKKAHATYKVFAHVMDPLDPEGQRRLTKGAGDKFTHHRGIFVGWSKAHIEGVGNVDTWHMKGNRQHFAGLFRERTGPSSATITARIEWRKGDRALLDELRTFIVHTPASNGAVTIDVASTITATAGATILRGDPEHAGVQFRAHEAVVNNKSAKYLFPKGKQPGNKGDKDMPWAAMTFKIGDRDYFVQHMSHPSLPKGNVYSAYRNYGRFGAYFQETLAKGKSATFRVRFYVSPGTFGEGAVGAMDRRYADYVNSGG